MSSAERERETQVYMAKLAEQAERYDGTYGLPCIFFILVVVVVISCILVSTSTFAMYLGNVVECIDCIVFLLTWWNCCCICVKMAVFRCAIRC